MPRFNTKEYRQLLEDENDDRTDTELPLPAYCSKLRAPRSTILGIVLFLLLLISVAFNISFMLTSINPVHEREQNGCSTKWAGLVQNVTQPLYPDTEYGRLGSDNPEIRDKLWEDMDIGVGLIHIPHDWAQEHGLPRSQVFPWDRTQGIYYTTAFHQLHCLQEVYSWMALTRKGKQPRKAWDHIVHCMDSLRQDVQCHADDTPWYVAPPEWEKHGYDKIQYRQCRNWDQLLGWMKERYACYKHFHDPNDGGDFLEHFRFCPEDSPYRHVMEKHFERKAAKQAEDARKAAEAIGGGD